MAKDKPSFVAYVDWKETFDALPDDKAGQLIKHIFAYVNDEDPKTEDILINAVFANIKNTLKRDLRKYEKIREKRSEAGKASANKRQQVSTSVESVQQTSTNSTVSVSVNGSVSVPVNDINSKKSLEDRMVDFQKKIFPNINEAFTREDANAFYRYWTEMNEGGYKMRFEKEKTWNIKARIVTWVSNKKVAQKNKDSRRSADELDREHRMGIGILQNENFLNP